MVVSTPELEIASIVLAGSFNPGIFHPAWLAANDLIPKIEAEAAENILVSADYTRFEVDWLGLEVIPERLTIMTSQAPYQSPLRDLAQSILTLLPHTPINAMGLNRATHYKLKNEDVWHSFGHRLAPKDPVWTDILKAPGTRRLMIQGERDDGKRGHVIVTVEPSQRVDTAIFIDINDHFARPSDLSGIEGAKWARDILTEDWRVNTQRINSIRSRLLIFASEGEGEK
ncbi:hypothetical protein [Lentzea albidocapillata]|nr:hypothetical protein [Lentzea albidocapillata]